MISRRSLPLWWWSRLRPCRRAGRLPWTRPPGPRSDRGLLCSSWLDQRFNPQEKKVDGTTEEEGTTWNNATNGSDEECILCVCWHIRLDQEANHELIMRAMRRVRVRTYERMYVYLRTAYTFSEFDYRISLSILRVYAYKKVPLFLCFVTQKKLAFQSWIDTCMSRTHVDTTHFRRDLSKPH